MKIVFQHKKVINVVNGLELCPVFNLPPGVEFALDERKLLDQWDDKNATARYIISSSVTPKILGKLTSCLTTTQNEEEASLSAPQENC